MAPPPPPPIDPKKVVADPNWLPVWKGAWEGMAKTDPDAKWLYQGWAIRGWTDNAGASRLKALYESVPHGQWVPLDMDISGIWKYWGNYSFFGAPFIWTTIHNMGGNDGGKHERKNQTLRFTRPFLMMKTHSRCQASKPGSGQTQPKLT